MKRTLAILITCCIFIQVNAFAQSSDREIKKGTVLTYKITEGNVAGNLKVTVMEWNPVGNIKLLWQTTGTKIKKGLTTFPYKALTDGDEVKIRLKPGNEVLTASAARWFAKYDTYDELLNYSEDADVMIDGVNMSLLPDQFVKEKLIVYNADNVSMDYCQGIRYGGTSDLTVGYVGFTSDIIIVGNYTDSTFTMDLVSIKNPVVKANAGKPLTESEKMVKDIMASLTPKGPVKLTRMPAAKFAKVKLKYPVLAAIENYDATKGGKVKKPITETYEYRYGTSTPNPPSLVDCLTADLRLIYNQYTQLINGTVDSVSNKSLPSAAAKKLLQVYMDKDFMDLPGYRPWTNWSFIRSLTEEKRFRLAEELQGYITTYGFTE